jgi:hypothetical protein
MLEAGQAVDPGQDEAIDTFQVARDLAGLDDAVTDSKPIQGAGGLLRSAEGVADQSLDGLL